MPNHIDLEQKLGSTEEVKLNIDQDFDFLEILIFKIKTRRFI